MKNRLAKLGFALFALGSAVAMVGTIRSDGIMAVVGGAVMLAALIATVMLND